MPATLLPAFDGAENRCPTTDPAPSSRGRLAYSLRPPPLRKDPYPTLPRSPTPRCRIKPLAHLILRRRRHGSRVDHRVEPLPLHTFDQLPWIATLNAAPSEDNATDLADLSLLPVPDNQAVGVGPIRRKKSQPRSKHACPFPPPLPHDLTRDLSCDERLLELSRNSFARNIPSCPSTPTSKSKPKLDPSRVTFRHLMPVTVPDDDDGI